MRRSWLIVQANLVPNCCPKGERLQSAFTQEYPGDDQLVYDNSGYHLECNEVLAAFRGKHWREVPFETLRYESAALSFMTPAAYRYYLPAYLLACILDYAEADMIPDTVVFSLIPPTDPKSVKIYGESYRRCMAGFTPAQRDTLRSFLEFMKARHGEDYPSGDLDQALASL